LCIEHVKGIFRDIYILANEMNAEKVLESFSEAPEDTIRHDVVSNYELIDKDFYQEAIKTIRESKNDFTSPASRKLLSDYFLGNLNSELGVFPLLGMEIKKDTFKEKLAKVEEEEKLAKIDDDKLVIKFKQTILKGKDNTLKYQFTKPDGSQLT